MRGETAVAKPARVPFLCDGLRFVRLRNLGHGEQSSESRRRLQNEKPVPTFGRCRRKRKGKTLAMLSLGAGIILLQLSRTSRTRQRQPIHLAGRAAYVTLAAWLLPTSNSLSRTFTCRFTASPYHSVAMKL